MSAPAQLSAQPHTPTVPASPRQKYRYQLLIGNHVEADYDSPPDLHHGLYPDKHFHGPCEIVSTRPDLHIKWPNKFAVPLSWNGEQSAPVPEGSLIFDPSVETIEDFVARATQHTALIAARDRRPNEPTTLPNHAVASSTGQGQTTSPPIPKVTLPAHARTLPNFDQMSLKELVQFAEEEEITLPSGNANANAVRAAVKQAVASKGTK